MIVALTGAGISAEVGIPTFRGKGGLWNKEDPKELATLSAFLKDPVKVWKWYDWRRSLIKEKHPSEAHHLLARKKIPVITQNVDGLHQRAGSEQVVELHGNLWRVRCLNCSYKGWNYDTPLKEVPPKCPECGGLLRPDVVWFGEPLPEEAIRESLELLNYCSLLLVIGTSGSVYPASQLPYYAKERGAKLVEINPEETPLSPLMDLKIRKGATEGLKEFFSSYEL